MNNRLIEFACYDVNHRDKVRNQIFESIELGANSISLPHIHMSYVSSFVPDGISVSCPIDYPYGRSDTSTRIHSILRASHVGANAIVIVANHTLFINGKLKEYIDDLSSIKDTCQKNGLTFKVILDYRVFNDGAVFKEYAKLTNTILPDFVYCSTGHLSEDGVDNIILCQILKKSFNMNVIANGGMYLPKHIEAVDKSEIYGICFHNINSLKNCLSGV